MTGTFAKPAGGGAPAVGSPSVCAAGMAGPDDAEVQCFLARLGDFRGSLTDRERGMLDALIQRAAYETEDGGPSFCSLSAKELALAAVLGLGIAAGTIGAAPPHFTYAAPLQGIELILQPASVSANPNMPPAGNPTNPTTPPTVPGPGPGGGLPGIGPGGMPGMGPGGLPGTGPGGLPGTGTGMGPLPGYPPYPGSGPGLTLDPAVLQGMLTAQQQQIAQLQQQLVAAQQAGIPNYTGDPRTNPAANAASSRVAEAQAREFELNQQIAQLQQQVQQLQQQIAVQQQQTQLQLQQPPPPPPEPPAPPPAAPPTYLPPLPGTDPSSVRLNAQIASTNAQTAQRLAQDALTLANDSSLSQQRRDLEMERYMLNSASATHFAEERDRLNDQYQSMQGHQTGAAAPPPPGPDPDEAAARQSTIGSEHGQDVYQTGTAMFGGQEGFERMMNNPPPQPAQPGPGPTTGVGRRLQDQLNERERQANEAGE